MCWHFFPVRRGMEIQSYFVLDSLTLLNPWTIVAKNSSHCCGNDFFLRWFDTPKKIEYADAHPKK